LSSISPIRKSLGGLTVVSPNSNISSGQNPGTTSYWWIVKLENQCASFPKTGKFLSNTPPQLDFRIMPNSPSASKRLRQTKVRTEQNKSIKSAMKTQIKKVLTAATGGDVATAETEFRLAAKKLDQAGAKNVIHKNAAARQKSRLQRAIKAAKAS
jgi:small subunit ribosomal protein S20